MGADNLRETLDEVDEALSAAIQAIDALANAGVQRAGKLALELRVALGARRRTETVLISPGERPLTRTVTHLEFDVVSLMEAEIDRADLLKELESERDEAQAQGDYFHNRGI